MSFTPPDELIAKWRAELAAFYDDQKREALEDFDWRWSKNTNERTEASQTSSETQNPPAALPQDFIVTSNGSSAASTKTPTAREMVLEVLSEFRDSNFTQTVIKEKILERWPDADAKYLPSRISQVLKAMSEKGEIERIGRGTRIQDPVIYREKESSEENLL